MGNEASRFRSVHDSMGKVLVPADKYWGAQTQRSFENFKIGTEKMPLPVLYAIAAIKKAAAEANRALVPDRMTEEKARFLSLAADEILSGVLDGHFPLSVWQTGSGTQTNMNVNEVIAARGCELAGRDLLHPNDDVNMSQSSNDVFPSAMHVAAVLETERVLLPSLHELVESLLRLESAQAGLIKTGRTHLQDATPLLFSQEISGWRASLQKDVELISSSLSPLRALALGGTAVGTGLNAPPGFDTAICCALSRITGSSFFPAGNKFHALSSKGELVFAHGALKALSADLMKIANDIRWLASGPRCGLGEIRIPANEPGSSIMPGKVNPTQCEAVTMVAVQVMGNDAAIGFAASQGNFELNVFMPVIIFNYLQSLRLLADVMRSFDRNCVSGIEADGEKMRANVDRSLMLATALTPHIGYESTAAVVNLAYRENITLKESCLRLGLLSEAAFDAIFHPERMC